MQAKIIWKYNGVLFNDTTGDLWKRLTTETDTGHFILNDQLSKVFMLFPDWINGTLLEHHGGPEQSCDHSWYSSTKLLTKIMCGA